MAESIFRKLVADRKLADQFVIDSCGTGDWHAGEEADPRTLTVLEVNQCPFPSRARQLCTADFNAFDYVVVMDDSNLANTLNWRGADESRVSKMLDWAPEMGHVVPDPYYGQLSDFHELYDMLNYAAERMLDEILVQRGMAPIQNPPN